MSNLSERLRRDVRVPTFYIEYAEKLEREIEQLRADAERYRWLRDHALGIDVVADPDNFVAVWHGTDTAYRSTGRTLDAAIDAAMKEGRNG